jgi:hypothetical protein
MSTDLSVSLQIIVDHCQQLTSAQAESKPQQDVWSVSEILEHLALVERAATVGIKRTLSQPPASVELLAAIAHKSGIISTRMAVRTTARIAPDSVLPTNRFGAWPGALDAFVKARKNTLETADASGERSDTHTMPHPILGDLTIRQWFEFLHAHAARHALQIESLLKSS